MRKFLAAFLILIGSVAQANSDWWPANLESLSAEDQAAVLKDIPVLDKASLAGFVLSQTSDVSDVETDAIYLKVTETPDNGGVECTEYVIRITRVNNSISSAEALFIGACRG